LTIIPLDRRFVEWSDGEPSDPDFQSLFQFGDDALEDWNDLLRRRRVVVLAEAGSGKTEEMKAQDKGGQVCVLRLSPGRGPQRDSGCLTSRRSVSLCRRATVEAAWFFIDSVDEAKLNSVRLEQALGEIATALHGAEGRAHVVLSGRHTDWEFRRDLRCFDETLPLPEDRVALPAYSPDDLVVKTIRQELRKESPAAPAEKSVVVLMKALDRERVRLFAQAKGARNLDDFLAKVESANLWRFARRPLDLEWMVLFWGTHGRLGSLLEMLQTAQPRGSKNPIQIVFAATPLTPHAHSRPSSASALRWSSVEQVRLLSRTQS